MKVFKGLEQYEKGKRTIATLGTFDGVHLGHRKIIQRIVDSAKAVSGESLIISFHPHPRLVLYPDENTLRLLQTIEEKIEMLSSIGVDKLWLIPFSKEFSRTPSEVFIENILVKTAAIKRVIVGYDHHFGKNRTGGMKELLEGASKFGFETEEIPAEQIDQANISSTKIRHALEAGDIQTANLFLGYSYPLTGTVVKGQQLGRELGYPTANIHVDDPLKLIPAEGVYFVQILIGQENFFGMLNIGKKPTVGDFPLGVEVNIFDFDRDLYGKKITVRFLDRIREDKKFNSLEELKIAISNDKQICLELILNLE